jgi:hypothetical protein
MRYAIEMASDGAILVVYTRMPSLTIGSGIQGILRLLLQ